MDETPAHTLLGPLAHRLGKDADAAQVARTIVEIWHEIDAALSPTLGHRGLAALYRRSLYLAGLTYPWLQEPNGTDPLAIDLDRLEVVLASQTSRKAVADGTALLDEFYGLLTSLVGPFVTRKLLSHVWGNSSSEPRAQEPSA